MVIRRHHFFNRLHVLCMVDQVLIVDDVRPVTVLLRYLEVVGIRQILVLIKIRLAVFSLLSLDAWGCHPVALGFSHFD